MSILKKIVFDLKRELKLKKSIIPISEFEKMSLFGRNTISMSNSIKKDNYVAENRQSFINYINQYDAKKKINRTDYFTLEKNSVMLNKWLQNYTRNDK